MLKQVVMIGMCAAAMTLSVPVTHAFADTCSQSARTSGECPSVTTDVSQGTVTIGAEITRSGTPGATTTAPAPPSRTAPARTAPRRPSAPILGTSQCRTMIGGKCRASSPSKNPPPPAPRVSVVRTPPTPPRTINDVAQFRPSTSGFVLEPGSWSLPRVPTNMYALAGEQTVPGQLLGWPVEVRFTPAFYHWDYGDGARGSLSTPGGSWGSEQFSPTSTTHVYRSPGTYLISLNVEYRASFRFNGGNFQALSGTVTVSGGSQELEVFTVTPVLVDQGCDVSTLVAGRC